jgi:hypothetical protein
MVTKSQKTPKRLVIGRLPDSKVAKETLNGHKSAAQVLNGTPKGATTSSNGRKSTLLKNLDPETASPLMQQASERRNLSRQTKKVGLRKTREAVQEYEKRINAPVSYNPEEPSEREKNQMAAGALKALRKQSSWSKEIGGFPLQINWERRLAAKKSLQVYCETYLKPVFFFDWSEDQIRCMTKAEAVTTGEGGKFVITMPRGGGKTAICRAATLRASSYGYKRYIWNIASTDPSGLSTLRFIKAHLEHNPLLHQDFPELCWPIICLEGSNRMAGSQLFMGQPTHSRIDADNIVYPTLQLPYEYAEYYWEHDPSSVRFIPEGGLVSTGEFSPGEKLPDGSIARPQPILRDIAGRLVSGISPKEIKKSRRDGIWIPAGAGAILRSAGIDGTIRGAAEANPVTLEQVRPDLVLLDDVQKDHKADSPIMCEKLIRLIDGAITGVSGPGQHIDVLMPCTVIREGDAADTYLDPDQKQDWIKERNRMVISWPAGITDFEITQDTPAGKLWNEYAQIKRKVKGQPKSTTNPFTDFYAKNRKVMDKGFKTSWRQRFDPRFEISAEQHAMDLRLANQTMFLSEYQNIGRRPEVSAAMLITAEQLRGKCNSTKRGIIPAHCNFLGAYLDIQNEIFFYMVMASDANFNATIVDYGTFPEIKTSFFTKDQCESWSMLTSLYFQKYPNEKGKAYRTSAGKIRAPLEAKIYHGLCLAIPELLLKPYMRVDGSQMLIQKMGIDTRWGQTSEVVKRFIKEKKLFQLVPSYGQALPATQRQLEEYEQREGWFFENQQHPNVREPKWVERPHPDGALYFMQDADRSKDFLFARLGSPMGTQGSLSLFRAPEDVHEMLSHHICDSEYPEPVAARGIIKNKWTVREGVIYDNDYLDCAYGCCNILSRLGVSFKTSEPEAPKYRPRLSELRRGKAQGNRTPKPTLNERLVLGK